MKTIKSTILHSIRFSLILFVIFNTISSSGRDSILDLPLKSTLSYTSIIGNINELEFALGLGQKSNYRPYSSKFKYEYQDFDAFSFGASIFLNKFNYYDLSLNLKLVDIEAQSDSFFGKIPFWKDFIINTNFKLLNVKYGINSIRDNIFIEVNPGIAYPIYKESTNILFAMYEFSTGYVGHRIDSLIYPNFKNYSKSEIQGFELSTGFSLIYDSDPLRMKFNIYFSKITSGPNLNYLGATAKINLIDYQTMLYIFGKNTFLNDIAEKSLFFVIGFEKLIIKNQHDYNLRFGLGFEYYLPGKDLSPMNSKLLNY